ncbi:MAG: biotin attachment protein [Candidatus Desulfofervidus auxilii]|nr:biotin attachment protein [Candidatus Desulfofervidus auxilii]
MEDIEKIIAEYKSNPFETYVISTPHTGIVSLKVKKGDKVKGTTGKWFEKKGTILYTILRQGNPKSIHAPIDGEIVDIKEELNGQFVEAKTPIMSIKHRLNKEEVVNKIIERFLYIFRAPETARYYFTPELNKKIEQKGHRAVIIHPGEEFLIMSRMKRDIPLIYEGEPGVIYAIYFKPNVTVEQGAPLLGICPPEQTEFISSLVNKIQLEWEET